MKKQTKNIIKLTVVVLMTSAIAIAAIAPVFGETIDSANQSVTSSLGNLGQASLQNREEALLTAQERVQNRLIRKEEIKTEIEGVKETVQAILSEAREALSATGVKKVAHIPESFVFAHELRERATGEAVKQLQRVLNADTETRITESGLGSPGKETNYFGVGTKRALLLFQKKHGLSQTGVFDSQTREKMNDILQNGFGTKEERMNQVRARFMNLLEKMQNIRERAQQIQEEEAEEVVEEETAEDDIEEEVEEEAGEETENEE